MDEYERAAAELLRVVEGTSDEDYELLRDTRTQDDDCRSIQTIMSHVVGAAYGYAGAIRNALGIEPAHPPRTLLTRSESLDGLPAALEYTAATLDGRWEMTDDEIRAVVIRSRWGVVYDLEQLLEHAIVHVLRHRRQIDRFLSERAAS
jgi:uncharacterized damage-inducible protein DinB